MTSRIVATFCCLGAILVLFQNCNEADFTQTAATSAVNVGNQGEVDPDSPNLPISQSLLHTPDTVFPKVDILFVVDESSSMGDILEDVRAGFESLNDVNFPENTKVAVTNSHPARVDESENIDFQSPFNASRAHVLMPGFMRLVDGNSIDAFLNSEAPAFLAQPHNRPADGSHARDQFSEPGCSAWFDPSDKNENGVSCFTANSQIVLQGLGQEAGVVSLFQLLKRHTLEGSKLFRDGAIVNVIFVSDTHDPGAMYFERDHAYADRPTYAELEAALLENNPTISSYKYSGVVPLPLAGDPLLEGLQVAGELPRNLQELSDVSEGNFWDFSYLDYIKPSRGLALHVANSDWESAFGDLIRTTGKTTQPLLALEQECQSITEVRQDGQNLEADQYTLVNSSTLRIDIEGLEERPYQYTIECVAP